MNEQKLSQRLMRVAEGIPTGTRLADIGSDHAYLPTYLVLTQKIAYAVAGEVVAGPYQAAKKIVMRSGLEKRIQVRLANGLAAIQPEDKITGISICGMGGSLIQSILEAGQKNGQLSGSEQLFLQPNIGEYALRKWLANNHYQITDEEIIAEDGKKYEIIFAQKSPVPVSYSEKELFFGPCLLEKNSVIFHEKWLDEIKKKKLLLQKLEQAATKPKEKIAGIKALIQAIEEVV